MPYTDNSLQNYVFGESDDRERLAIVHAFMRANFITQTLQVLDQYGLAQRLEQARLTATRLQILDLGCAEGLFLHDLAALLEERGLLGAAELNGLDVNTAAIATAEAYAKISSPPRPYLNFYVWNMTQPLTDNLILRAEAKTQFDYIYALSVLEYLGEARQQLERIYHMLKPGGIIYLRCLVTKEGSDGWIALHPVLAPLNRAVGLSITGLNGGIDVATNTAAWLREVGAEDVREYIDKVQAGGAGPRGRESLRSTVLLARNAAPHLIRQGLLTQAQYDEILTTLYRELGSHLTGQYCTTNVVGRKPLTAYKG
jgi:2-polyprenyl-3-methyl-5-hydroxy-6-metoxy-1,4-benzoquinol methylase